MFASINDFLTKMPISVNRRHETMRKIMLIEDYLCNKGYNRDNISVVRSNSDYGHEYWIKKYSNWNKCIYGLIEHGLFLGRNTNMVGLKYDYEPKTILTFGDYREDVIKPVFKDFRVYKIGPRIAYSETDCHMYDKLKKQAGGGRVLTLFPFHSSSVLKATYDVDYLISLAKIVMEKHGCDVLRVCLPKADLDNGNADVFIKEKCDIVSAGNNPISFLPNLRAIIEATDLTMSNALGTNLGYCIYLGKQQILIPQERSFEGKKEEIFKEQEIMHSKNTKEDKKKEEIMFQDLFHQNITEEITEEQYNLCNYFWGYDFVRSSKDMYELLSEIKEYAYKPK